MGQRVHGGTLGHANLIAGLYRISGGKRRFNVSKKEFLLLWNAIVFYQFLNAVIAVFKVFVKQDGRLHRIFIYIKEPELASLLNIADRLKKVETALADILPLDQFIERIEKIETYISTSKEVLNLEEVCLLLNTSKSQIYRLTRLMAIPHYKPTGKSLYFNRKEVLEWIQSHPIGVNLENVKALENGTAPVKCIESRNENKI